MSIKIALLGDICLNGKFDLKNNLNYKDYFKDVSEFLASFDHVIANLETPLTDRTFTLTCKGLHLKSSLGSVNLLNYLNVTHVSLANNHIYDYGAKGLNDTINVLIKNGIDYYGVKGKQVVIQETNNKIAINGYCCFSSNPSACHKKAINPLIPQNISNKIKANNSNGFLNLISLHWGDENIHYPRIDHVDIARYLSSEHPVIIHGHHTHVIQGIETKNGSLIAYSQGNFCTDDVKSDAVKGLKVVQNKKNKESFILSLEIDENKIVKQQIVPLIDNGKNVFLGSNEIMKSLDVYSIALNQSKDEYIGFRSKQFKNITRDNESRRNMKWFFRRMNYYFIGAYIKGKISKIRYDNVMKFLKDNN